MFGYLYMIKNKVNNKVYIGKTYNTIYERYKEHLHNAFSKKEDSKLYQEMRLFGESEFELSLLGKWDEMELEYKEIEFIKLFDSWKSGYNQSVGGEGYYKNQERDNNLISDYLKGNRDISNLAKKYKLAKNIVHKILYRNNVKEYLKTLKPIAMFDENGDYIKKFSCLVELTEETGFDEKEIKRCLNSRFEKYNGLSFSYNCPF